MIYALSFVIFGVLFFISVVVDLIVVLTIKFTKNEELKEKLRAIEPKINKFANFTLFMTLP